MPKPRGSDDSLSAVFDALIRLKLWGVGVGTYISVVPSLTWSSAVAADQLECLQRQRKGENVPPPLNVNVGRRA
jgi:hypothetical protein